MFSDPNRRQFLTAAGVAAGASLLPTLSTLAVDPPVLKGKLRKAMIVGKLKATELQPLKDAGFDGVETTNVCPDAEATEDRKLIDSIGLRVHSVLRGWMSFNSDNPEKVEETIELTRAALRSAKIYGADAILLVPCRVGGVAVPKPGDFDIEFDEKTGHVSRVVKGDNEPYAHYIREQNRATDTSKAAVEKLIPLAEELKVKIGLENVWNDLWCSPKLYKNFVASFASPWVQAYFDIGNHVKYSPPELWIQTLGKLICKLHVKDFKLTPEGHDGKFVHPRDGSINWPAVRKVLSDIEYDGWATIEDSRLPLPEFAKRFDLIAAGL
jgi:L-ribulose-5-phosphate 3-epimerase